MFFFFMKEDNPKDLFDKEGIINVKDYCKNVDIELNAWRAKLYNVMRQMDDLPEGDKQRINVRRMTGNKNKMIKGKELFLNFL